MNLERKLKLLLVAFTGLLIPTVSGLFSYRVHTWQEWVIFHLFFMIAFAVAWLGCERMPLKLGISLSANDRPYEQVIRLYFYNALFIILISAISLSCWAYISHERIPTMAFVRAVIFFLFLANSGNLIREILLLRQEKKLHSKVVTELDRERMDAELEALRNQLDPHFLFNSLNTLSQLISSEPAKAAVFNHTLAKVYQSYLINKNNDLVSLREEIELLENYLYLLDIRFPDCVQVHYNHNRQLEHLLFLPPGALQCLAENAIKHNQLSTEQPIHIRIDLTDKYIEVSNTLHKKQETLPSYGTGLRNLNSRYLLLSGQKIITNQIDGLFLVSLPLIKTPA
jgi:sensor histidine kinase YesM